MALKKRKASENSDSTKSQPSNPKEVKDGISTNKHLTDEDISKLLCL